MVKNLECVEGARYGKYVVLKNEGVVNHHTCWIVQCDCGNVRSVQASSLLNGNTKSCGCYRADKQFELFYVDRVGTRYGRLVVVAFAGTDGKRHKWKCLCDCGNIKDVEYTSLSNGNTKSCGCKRLEGMRIAPGMASFNDLLADYQRGAKKRGYCFELTRDEFYIITQQDCVYCGAKPLTIKNSTKKKNAHGDFFYNGVDRIDNTLGYTKDNVQPCCPMCNRAKMDYPKEVFHDWIQRLVKHNAVPS